MTPRLTCARTSGERNCGTASSAARRRRSGGETTSRAQPRGDAKRAAAAAADGEDDFDMFGDFDEEKLVPPKSPAEAAAVVEDAGGAAAGGGGGILEGDDKDGYYKIRPGEVLNGRYQIQSTVGRGMFSGVVRAMDLNSKRLVAIKIMRNNDALRKGGLTEIAILQKLNDADPDTRSTWCSSSGPLSTRRTCAWHLRTCR